MKNKLLVDIKELCKKHNGILLERTILGKITEYEIALRDSDIRIVMKNRRGGAL